MGGVEEARVATMEYLVKRVRLELSDDPYPFEASFFPDGIEFQFPLDQAPIKEGSVLVTCDGRPFTDFDMDYRHGVMLFSVPPPAGSTFYVAGIRYKYFNDEDLRVFCQDSINEHQTGSVDIFGINTSIERMPSPHVHAVAIRACILALWALVTDAAFDIDISAPDGVHIPRSQRFGQLMGLINLRQAEYDGLAKALNIGIFRVEVYTLRRIAYRTNRLVPIYMTQEYDDARPPTRLFTDVSTQGNAMPVEGVPTIDLVLRRGSYFVHDLVLGTDLTTQVEHGNLSAEVLRYPGQAVPRAKFGVTVLDKSTGSVRLEMDARTTRSVPNDRSYWQLVIRGDKESFGSALVAQGSVRTERPVSPASGVINESYLGG
jgi:hypothetical protein